MHGCPSIRAAMVFAIFVVLGLPVWSITHPKTVASPMESQKVEKQMLQLRLTFAHQPSSISVQHLGEVVWKETTPALNIEHALNIELPKEGVDFEIKAQWPTGTPATGVRVQLKTRSAGTLEKTVWGEGELDEVITFP
jgi:hypothetical protein